MIKWTSSKQEMMWESMIADRAVKMAQRAGQHYDKMTAVMDIDACHSNGNPLKLVELSGADDFNFAHDVFGIRNHIDRETGQLKDCFSPRYSKQGG